MTKKTIQRVIEHFPKIRFGGIHDPTAPNLFDLRELKLRMTDPGKLRHRESFVRDGLHPGGEFLLAPETILEPLIDTGGTEEMVSEVDGLF